MFLGEGREGGKSKTPGTLILVAVMAGETARDCISKRWLILKIHFKKPLNFHLLHLDSQCKGKVFDTEFFQINRRSFSRQDEETFKHGYSKSPN